MKSERERGGERIEWVESKYQKQTIQISIVLIPMVVLVLDRFFVYILSFQCCYEKDEEWRSGWT